MMGFFVVLLAMNMPKPNTGGIGGVDKEPGSGDSAAMQDFAIELRAAFGNAVDPNSTDPRDAPLRRRLLQRQTSGPSTSPGPDGHKHEVQATKPSDWVAPFGIVQFDTNQGAVTAAGRTTIVQVSEQLRGRKAVIEVRGHVSATEAARDTGKARDLAYKRAYGAAQVLAENGVRWEQMRLVSCGDSFPLRGRADTTEEHRLNQRVEIVMTQETMPADQFKAEAPAEKP
jgi:outer membrane protein OmpA-like peptidoglycan-associated protein